MCRQVYLRKSMNKAGARNFCGCPKFEISYPILVELDIMIIARLARGYSYFRNIQLCGVVKQR